MNKVVSKITPEHWRQSDKTSAQLRQEFLSLLDKELPEQAYQRFLETNTRLIPREFVQNHGIHFRLVLRKLSFGADYRSDFAYLSKSSDDWNCVLIEIEKPSSRFFRRNSNDPHPEFLKALAQINQWRAWFKNDTNKISFGNNTIGMIRVPLSENPIYPKFVLVHGRRAEYAKSALRRSLVAAHETDDFKIITFDSLLEELEHKYDFYLGVRRNEYIDIRSDKFLDESMFVYMSPDQIQITPKLHANALAYRHQWIYRNSFNGGLAMDTALGGVRIRRMTAQRKTRQLTANGAQRPDL